MKQLLYTCLLLFCLVPSYTLRAQEKQIEVTQIAPKVYVHTTYNTYNNVRFPSHGLLISTKEGVVMIDTGWGNGPTEQLLDWVKTNLKQPVVICVPTHYHDDKMGGIEAMQAQGIPVMSLALTAQLATEHKLGTPDVTFPTDTTFTVGGQHIEVYYPGGGHTPDNVVVYLHKQKILFGGCLVKDAQAQSLGNTADADMDNWANAIQNVQQRFPKAKVVIPSHGPWGDKSALSHTLDLLRKQ